MNRLPILTLFAVLALSACNLSDPSEGVQVGTENNVETDAGTPNNSTTGNNGTTAANATTAEQYLEVVSVTPAADATDVPVDTTVVLTFSDDLDLNTITRDVVQVSSDAGPVDLTSLVADGTSVELDFTPLQPGAVYTIELPATVSSLEGNTLDGPFSTSFTTVPPFDVVAVTPENGSDQAELTAPVELTFTSDVDPETFTATLTFEPAPFDGREYTPAATIDGSTVRLLPGTGHWREFKTTHKIAIHAESTNGTGAVDFTISFTTKMFDATATYRIYNEGQSGGEVLVVEDLTSIVFDNPNEIERTRWTFQEESPDVWVIGTTLYRDYFLEGSDGSDPILLVRPDAGTIFTGQLWRFAQHPYEGRLPQDESTTFFRYYMQTEFAGAGLALNAENRRPRMTDIEQRITQAWHFERLD